MAGLRVVPFFVRTSPNRASCLLAGTGRGGKGNNMSPLPSCLKSLFESEAKGKAIDLKMILYSYANKTRFHKKGCALSLVLKVRVFGTRKWIIREQKTLAHSLI